MWGCTIRRLLVAGAVACVASMLVAPAASADHGEGHNGETLELSKSEDVEDGEVVTVALASWLPGKTATIVTCYSYPALGPTDCELSNYGAHTVTIGEDGTGTLDYPVAVVPGRCDATIPCFIVAGDGFGPNANYAAQQFTFAAATAVESEPEPTEAPEPEPTEAPEPEPISEPEPEPEPTATEAPEPEPEAPEEVAAPFVDDDDGGSSPWVWLIPVIIGAAVLALAGLWLSRRRAAT